MAKEYNKNVSDNINWWETTIKGLEADMDDWRAVLWTWEFATKVYELAIVEW